MTSNMWMTIKVVASRVWIASKVWVGWWLPKASHVSRPEQETGATHPLRTAVDTLLTD